MLSQYLDKLDNEDKVNDPFLNELLLQKLPQITLDSWQKIFFALLEAYKDHKNFLFMPEIYDIYWINNKSQTDLHSNFEEPFRRLTQITAEINSDDFYPKERIRMDKIR